MTRRYRVISGDGHLEIPPDPWIRHVPDEHRDRAPRLTAQEVRQRWAIYEEMATRDASWFPADARQGTQPAAEPEQA